MSLPPKSVYPLAIDSDYTLLKVYNTSEARLISDNQAWAEEVNIAPVPVGKHEIWANNGYANVSGELFYYDSVDRCDQGGINVDGDITTLKRCSRNLDGSNTQFNKRGDFVRGFLVAEHHNLLVDATIEIEKMAYDLKQAMDYLNLLDCVDDFNCPVVTFYIYPQPEIVCVGTIINYSVVVNGVFDNLIINFGDGQESINLTGTHHYAPGQSVDPVVTITNNSCVVVATPTNSKAENMVVPIPKSPLTIPIPDCAAFPPFNPPTCDTPSTTFAFPPIVFPCINAGGISGSFSITIPSLIVFSGFNISGTIPSLITVVGINISGVIPTDIYVTGIPSMISIMGGLPSKISIVGCSIPSMISINGSIPSMISVYNPIPSTISIIGCAMPSLISVTGCISLISVIGFPSIISITGTPPSTISIMGISVISIVGYTIPSVISVSFPAISVISITGISGISITGMPSVISITGCVIPSTISVIGCISTISITGLSLISVVGIPSVISITGLCTLPSVISVTGNTMPSIINIIGCTIPSIISLSIPNISVLSITGLSLINVIGIPSVISVTGCTIPSIISVTGCISVISVTGLSLINVVGIPSVISITGLCTLPSIISIIGISTISITGGFTLPSTISVTGGFALPGTITVTGNIPSTINIIGCTIPSVISINPYVFPPISFVPLVLPPMTISVAPISVNFQQNIYTTVSLVENLPRIISLVGVSIISITGNTLPSLIIVSFQNCCSIPAMISFGTPPVLSITWGTIPNLVCTLSIVCPSVQGFMNPNMKYDEYFEDDFNPQMAIQPSNLGIPSQITIVAPTISDIKVVHDLPQSIEISMPKIPDIRIIGPERELPTEIKIISNDIPSSITLTLEAKIPESILLDTSSLPNAIWLQPVPNFPTTIFVDGSSIPAQIQIVGMPDSIELKHNLPNYIELRIPENLEIPLVYKGGPVPLTFTPANIVGIDEDSPCFMMVPCRGKT